MIVHSDSWDDMSSYLVHFTRGGNGNDDYASMLGILSSGSLRADKPFGIGRSRAPSECEQKAVCLSEIPPASWQRLVQRRETKFGIGFKKEFILSRGGAPVWYAWKETAAYKGLQEMMLRAANNVSDPIWQLTPLIEAPGIYDKTRYIFDWEREWRHIGTLGFEPTDVAFLLMPEDLHEAASGFFKTAFDDNLGPAYFCPYLDPAWDRNRIAIALSINKANKIVEVTSVPPVPDP